VSVNLATDPATGERTATQVTALTAQHQLYLPLLRK